MKRRSCIQASLLFCIAALTSCSGDQGQADEILIGEYGSLTGTTATFGISTMNGIAMALDEVNESGGLLGKTVRVIVEDDQGRPEEAQTVVTKLITRNRVVALLGEVASSRTLAAAPVAQQMRIPMVSPSSTNPAVTEVGDFIFRVCFIDPFQGLVMAKFRGPKASSLPTSLFCGTSRTTTRSASPTSSSRTSGPWAVRSLPTRATARATPISALS